MDNREDLAKISMITFDLPFMINLPDGEYLINLEEIQALVLLTRHKGDPKGVPEGVIFPSDSYVAGDRWGRFQYTQVSIQVKHLLWIKVYLNLPTYILSIAAVVVNRIMDVCRGIRGDHYIRIIPSDIFSYKLGYVDPGGNVRPLVLGTVHGNVINMGGAEKPTQNQTDRVKNVLENNTKLPVFREILLNAYDYHYYGNYRAAVIEAGTAFEVFVKKVITDGYEKLGKNEEFIDKQLDAGLKNLLRDHMGKIIDHDFLSHQLYNEWNRLAYELRNDVVHKGKIVTGDESRIAVEITTKAIRFIENRITTNTFSA